MATKYIAPSGGSDSNSGDIGTPWATLLKGLNTVAAGDTIELRGGTYNQTFFKGVRDTVTIQNYPGEAVTFQAASTTSRIMGFQNSRGVLIRKNPLGGSFTVRNSDASRPAWYSGSSLGDGIEILYDPGQPNNFGISASTLPTVTIDGLIFENMVNRCIYAWHTGVIVRNCNISTGSVGVLVQGTTGQQCPGSIVEDNEIHHLDRLFQDTRDGSTTDDAGAVGVNFWLTDGGIARRNYIHHNSATSNQFGKDGGGVETYRSNSCEFYDNIFESNEGCFETGTNGSGGTASSGNKFYRNFIKGTMNYNGASPTFLQRANPSGQITHNTIVIDGGGADGLTAQDVFRLQHLTGTFGGSIAGLVVRDNLVVLTNTAHKVLEMTSNVHSMSPPMILDYNLFYAMPPLTGAGAVDTGLATYSLAQLASYRSATTYGDHDIWGSDPLPTAAGYPTAGSPAIGAASDGTDIGAYQHQESSIPVTVATRPFGRRHRARRVTP